MANEVRKSIGENEIASCVFEPLNSDPTMKRKLTIWSDNCLAQTGSKKAHLAVVTLPGLAS